MKITVSIYKGKELVIKKQVNGIKQAVEIEKENIPPMTMKTKVTHGWRSFWNY